MPDISDRRKSITSTALLETLTDSAALPALVERLEPQQLKHLVDTVGLEDAGALVACANPSQLAYLIDESIWASVNPGDPESLSVPELLRWFALWLDMGDGFIAEKLFELGEGFSALAFARLVTVSAVDLGPGDVDEFSVVIGEYLVRAAFEDHWDTLQAALVALWDDYPDFLEAVFARLSFRHSILGMSGEDDTPQVLEADASHLRATRKEAGGFVASPTASAFLRDCASADLDLLVNERAYDPETAEYFKRRSRNDAASPGAETSDRNPPAAEASEAEEATEAELDDLQRELERYEVLHDERVARLTGPGQSGSSVLPVRRALATLAADPERLEARSNELAYLSNLLLAQIRPGGTSRDERLTESQAANLVMSTCNLGGSYALWADAREAEEDHQDSPFVDMVGAEPGLVRLFRIGWNLINHLPAQAVNRLTQVLSSPPVAQRLAGKPWLAAEVDSLVHQPSLVGIVRDGDFEQAQEAVKVLTIVLEPAAVAVLCLLIDQVPRLAELLETPDAPTPFAATVNNSGRFIASMQDLRLLERFFSELSEHVRV